MNLPKKYQWLQKETAPRHLLKAVELYGTTEIVGPKSNPVIMGWAQELGMKHYTNDDIPWCLGGETSVTTLHGYKFIKDIQEGLDFVFTREGEYCKVLKVLTREKPLNKVYITGALPFEVTDDHPFLIKKIIKNSEKRAYRIYKDELEWIPFKDIQKGDLVCKPKCKIFTRSELDNKPKEYIELLGIYAAEGTTRKRVIGDVTKNIKSVTPCSTLHIGKHDIEKVKSLIHLSGIGNVVITERRTNYQISSHNSEFVEHCSQIGFKGIEKHIPYYILNGTEYVKENFLKGYLESDGHFNPETNYGSASSVSKKLILGVGKLLFDSGIFPTFREDLREGTMVIEGRTVNVKNRYIIQYYKSEKNYNSYYQDDDYFYLPIKKIKKSDEVVTVYDLQVENNQNFIANDIVVHNCGLYIAIVMKRSDRQVVKDPLWARNWANFGVAVKEPMLGDVLVFSRETGGHVGLYISESRTHYHVLGGNQSDQVNIVLIAKNRLVASRRPPYNVQPLNVRKIVLDSAGTIISTNEA
jgi:uncharacterized protein (TIGR02594 family)